MTTGGKRPLGQPTRGKTAPGRLRRVDNFLLMYAPGLFTRRSGAWRDAFFVDLGFGAHPGTTLESAARFRRLNPKLPVLGVEIDSERVQAALPFSDELTFFREGGFNLPLRHTRGRCDERVAVIRAFNVLRQYDEAAVPAAHKLLCAYLLPGGVLIEGTSDPLGRIWVASLLRKGPREGFRQEALVFSFNFKEDFNPALFQAVLPKKYIHRMLPGEEIHTFFSAWKAADQQALSRGILPAEQRFRFSGRCLREQGWPVAATRRWLSRGFLILYTDR